MAARPPLRALITEFSLSPFNWQHVKRPFSGHVKRIQHPQGPNKRTKVCAASPDSDVVITTLKLLGVPLDAMVIIFHVLWLTCNFAPRLAAVCTTFRDVSKKCVGTIHYKLLSAPGAVLNLAPGVPYLVDPGLHTSALQALGGPGLAICKPFWALGEKVAQMRVLQGDLCSLMDVQPKAMVAVARAGSRT